MAVVLNVVSLLEKRDVTAEDLKVRVSEGRGGGVCVLIQQTNHLHLPIPLPLRAVGCGSSG